MLISWRNQAFEMKVLKAPPHNIISGLERKTLIVVDEDEKCLNFYFFRFFFLIYASSTTFKLELADIGWWWCDESSSMWKKWISLNNGFIYLSPLTFSRLIFSNKDFFLSSLVRNSFNFILMLLVTVRSPGQSFFMLSS